MKKITLSTCTLLLTALLLWGCGQEIPKEPCVKNLIFLIGDGMGLAHASMLQVEEDYRPTAFDRAENVVLTKTRSLNNRVTDSAASGTALATGHKTNNSHLGVTPEGEPLISMMERAHEEGWATGLVVTYYLQHATPAAFYAHRMHRNDREGISHDLLACDYDLLVGGGGKWLAETCDAEGSFFDAFARKGYHRATTLAEIEATERTPLLGVVAERGLPSPEERGDFLPRATAKSLQLLSEEAARRGEGFMLMVEGSLIDMASHDEDLPATLAEMRDFEKTAQVAIEFADRNPGTLVVIAADHETGGVLMTSNESDFTQAESGLLHKFGCSSHTASMVPIYLYGTGADRINGVMENSAFSQRLHQLLGLQ